MAPGTRVWYHESSYTTHTERQPMKATKKSSKKCPKLVPLIAMFDDIETAWSWRRKRGGEGWLWVSESGPVLWFAQRFSVSAIFDYAEAKGLPGKML